MQSLSVRRNLKVCLLVKENQFDGQSKDKWQVICTQIQWLYGEINEDIVQHTLLKNIYLQLKQESGAPSQT